MKFIRLQRAFTAARHYARVLITSGPLGLLFAVKLSWLDRRLGNTTVYMDREKDLHRDHMAALKHEQTKLIEARQRLLQTAAQYQRELDARAPAQGAQS